jgi:hypothetical protein
MMRNCLRTAEFGYLVSALLASSALVSACGGDDGSSDVGQLGGSGGAMNHDASGATGGSTETGGRGGGGNTSTGGAANTGGGAEIGGAADGSAAGGGTAGSGGGAEITSDASGADVSPNPGECPSSVPANGTPCSGSQFCYIGQVQCGCYENIGQGWLCAGGDSGNVTNCPVDKPVDASPCPADKGLSYCHYATGVCICGGRGGGNGHSSNWVCT